MVRIFFLLLVHNLSIQKSVYNMKTELFIIYLFMSAATITGWAAGGQAGNLTWDLSEDGTLTIIGTGVMDDYRGSVPWSIYNVKKIVITDGVTTIGNYAFSNCANATSITIPNTVTAIGVNAFRSCRTA
jgi:hypothetical protein